MKKRGSSVSGRFGAFRGVSGSLLRAVLCCAALVLFAPRAGAQKLAVKANALSWLTTTPQAEVEGAVGAHWTVGLAGSWNPWTFGDNKKFKHWEVRPMGRYWLWESFNGHFFGVNAEYAQFNVGGMKATPFGLMFSDTDKTRYEGSYFGAGVSYGYSWMLSPRWSIEGEVGVGYRRSSYRSYDCVTCGRPTVDGDPKQHKGYFGPTRLAVSVIFMIK